ncbi:MAG TPA: hypothetical protein VJT72_21970 [Pseudonocardiaceae bacterium]|nr:hypothetical protein [Pseudonocardiaceae bacterium]
MFGDIGQPQPIWRLGGEITADQVIVDWWADLAVLAALALAENTPPTVVRADPPGGALGHRLTGVTRLLNEAAVAKLRVVVVGVKQCVGPVGLEEFGVGTQARARA